MLKKIILAAVAALALTAPSFAQETWDRNHEACDSQGPNGTLCLGLASYYRLDEPADYFRAGLTGGALAECLGTDVATSSTARWGLDRSASFDGSNNKGFIVPGGGSFGGGTWTLAVWVYVTDATKTSTILSTMSGASGKEGITLDLFYTGSALNARARSYMQDSDTVLTTTNTTNVTASAWHLIVFQSGHSVLRKLYATNALKVSVDNGTFTSTTWTNAPRTNSSGHLVIGKQYQDVNKETGACQAIGGGFYGYLQGLAIWGRALTAADLSLFYNGGNGRDFPFVN
jgi:hypothetical protein